LLVNNARFSIRERNGASITTRCVTLQRETFEQHYTAVSPSLLPVSTVTPGVALIRIAEALHRVQGAAQATSSEEESA
jgi:hypothetical protein